MVRKQEQFPLVADGEILVGPNPTMHLYEESDLISNIRGPYHEKDFAGTQVVDQAVAPVERGPKETELLPPLFEAKRSPYSRKERAQSLGTPSREGKTQGQLAREAAREDLKRKRSAGYLKTDKPTPAKVFKQTPPQVEDKQSSLSQVADRLRQTHYILADMPAVYSLKKEDREQEQAAPIKNSYDFLRKSQVYNYPERKIKKERQLAQELNLTHIEEEYNG